MKDKGLRISRSTLPGVGQGLFAYDKQRPYGELMFKKGDTIAQYDGETVTKAELDRRYGQYTAPYGLQANRKAFEDGACHRGIGSLINAVHHQKDGNVLLVDKNHTLLVEASKGIRNGDELFTYYGKAYRFDDPVTYRAK